MRTLLILFLSLSFVFTGPWPQVIGANIEVSDDFELLPDEVVTQTELEALQAPVIPDIYRLAFLRDVINRVVTLQEFNDVELERLAECLKSEVNTCPDDLLRYQHNIRELYPRIRKALLIYNMVDRIHEFYENFYSNNQAEKLRRSRPAGGLSVSRIPMDHPLVGGFMNHSIPFPDYTDEEIIDALSGYDDIALAAEEEDAPGIVSLIAEHSIIKNLYGEGDHKKMINDLILDKDYRLNLEGIMRLWCDLTFEGDRKVCDGLKPKYDAQYGKIYFDAYMADSIGPGMHFIARDGNSSLFYRFMQKQGTGGTIAVILLKYLRQLVVHAASLAPYAALVTDAEPEQKEIAEAVKLMREASKDSLERIRKEAREAKESGDEKAMLEFLKYDLIAAKHVVNNPGPELCRLMYLGQPDMPCGNGSEQDSAVPAEPSSDESLFDLSAMTAEALGFDEMLPAESLATATFAGTDFTLQDIHADVMSRFMSQTWSKVGWELGIMAAGAIGCVAPAAIDYFLTAGRAVKWGLTGIKNLFRFIRVRNSTAKMSIGTCVSAQTILFNGYFIVDSLLLYNETYDTVFGSVDGRNLAMEFSTLADADRSMLIAALLSPLGTLAGFKLSATAARNFPAAFAKLSPRAQRYYQSLGTNAHELRTRFLRSATVEP